MRGEHSRQLALAMQRTERSKQSEPRRSTPPETDEVSEFDRAMSEFDMQQRRGVQRRTGVQEAPCNRRPRAIPLGKPDDGWDFPPSSSGPVYEEVEQRRLEGEGPTQATQVAARSLRSLL